MSPFPCHLLPLILVPDRVFPRNGSIPARKVTLVMAGLQVSDHFCSALPLGPFLIFSWSGHQKLVGQNTSGAATFMTDHNCYEFPHVRPDRFLSRHCGRWQGEDHETKGCFFFFFLTTDSFTLVEWVQRESLAPTDGLTIPGLLEALLLLG